MAVDAPVAVVGVAATVEARELRSRWSEFCRSINHVWPCSAPSRYEEPPSVSMPTYFPFPRIVRDPVRLVCGVFCVVEWCEKSGCGVCSAMTSQAFSFLL